MTEEIKQIILAYDSQKIARLTLEQREEIANIHDKLLPYDRGRVTNWRGCTACFNKSAHRLALYIQSLPKEVKNDPQPTIKRSKKRGRPAKSK